MAQEDEPVEREEALDLLRGGPEGVAEWNQRRNAGERIPDLSDLSFGRPMVGANLSDTVLTRADFGAVNLTEVDLRRADLRGVQFNVANLTNADLRGADLRWSRMRMAKLEGTLFGDAKLYGTVFEAVDLSGAKELDAVRHFAPSSVDVETLYLSGSKVPDVFWRGCGIPEGLICYLPSLVGSASPIQFYSCFISYSTADEEFAARLHNDFQAAGIRCWKWDHDARTGRNLWDEIDKAIRVNDRLVLIASEYSLKSPAVNREIERAMVQEDERAKMKPRGKKKLDADVLFPVRLDDYIFTKWNHERKVDVTKKVIADARGWDTDPKVYAKVRDRLIRDLKSAK